MSAPEEAVRLIDLTLPAASEPVKRIEMLRLKDDALAVLERGVERMANLAEMTALSGAVSDPGLDAEVRLRRASAARANEDYELAAELARGVCTVAETSGDRGLELSACLELGQAITRSPIGEGYVTAVEVDIEAAAEAAGIAYRYVPIIRGIGPADVECMQEAMAEAGDGKLLAFCRSGTRSALTWALAKRSSGALREELEEKLAEQGFNPSPIAHLL